MPVMDPSTLRDRLRTREEDDRDNLAGLTLGAVLGCEKRSPAGHVNRTLNDIIREEANGYKDVLGQPPHTKMTWKSFKERLRIRRAGSNWTSSMPIPASDVHPTTRNQLSRRQSTRVPMMYTTDPPPPTESAEESPGAPENPHPVEPVQANTLRSQFSRHNSIRAAPSRTFSRADSTRLPTGSVDGPVISRRLSTALAEERELQRAESAAAVGGGGGGNGEEEEEEDEEEEDEEEAEEEGADAAPRMSLMALLEETDRQAGIVGPTYVFNEEEDDDDDDEDEEGESGGGIEYNCCVCMVRHKGAAFIPCGHTFCRLCSRELWVSRGNCPLCNGFILEILDIF